MLMNKAYHFSDVNEKGNCYQMVMLMDGGVFGDANELAFFG
jgi:hypothetical protein